MFKHQLQTILVPAALIGGYIFFSGRDGLLADAWDAFVGPFLFTYWVGLGFVITWDVVRLNHIRRQERALQLDGLHLGASENDNLFCFVRTARDGDVIVVVNLDPNRPHDGFVHVPLERLGIAPHQPFTVEDRLTGARYTWQGPRNYVRLDPWAEPGHVLRVHRPHGWVEREYIE